MPSRSRLPGQFAKAGRSLGKVTVPSKGAASRDTISTQRFAAKQDAAAKLFVAAVETHAESSALSVRRELGVAPGEKNAQDILYEGAKLWRDECLLSLKTLFQDLIGIASQYQKHTGNKEPSEWARIIALRIISGLFKFASPDSSIFHTWLATAAATNQLTAAVPPTFQQTYPDWFVNQGLGYWLPSKLSAMFRTPLEEEVTRLWRRATIDSVAEPRMGKHPASKKGKLQLKRERVIFGAIQAKLRGPKYCSMLDARKLMAPETWREDGWPGSYHQAYKNPKWRKKIHDEKHRFRVKYDKLTPAELARIIEDS